MNYTAGERKKITSDDVDMRSSVDERGASLHDCFSSACLHFPSVVSIPTFTGVSFLIIIIWGSDPLGRSFLFYYDLF